MKSRIVVLTLLLTLVVLTLRAQDDLMDLLEEEVTSDEQVDFTIATFKATRIINGHSIETRDKGILVFMISHRFGTVDSGIRDLFGLDESKIRFALEYGLTDNLDLGFGRSSFEKTYDGFVKYRFLRQSSGLRNVPVSMVFFGSIAVNTSESIFPFETVDFSTRTAYAYKVLIARKFSRKFSFQLTPTMIHRNKVVATQDNDVWALGLGGRYLITRSTSINAEYFPQFNGQEGFYDAFAVGVDIETGGHVFQIHLTNARAMIEKGFVAETVDDFWDGKFRLGFNISRAFDLRPVRK
jgi:hypothetical protein